MTAQHIDNTFGAAYIGVVVAGMLYGVSFVQTWYYFLKYRQDVWYIKTLVAAVWMFETVHQALISHTVYYYVITNYNSPDTLGKIVWSVLLEVLFNVRRQLIARFLPAKIDPQGLIGLLVQSFLTLRVWRLSGNNVPLTMVVGTLVLGCFGIAFICMSFADNNFSKLYYLGCSVAFTVQSLQLQTWVDLAQLKGLSMAVNLLGAATDVIIAAALFVFLHRSRTGFKKSDTMISKLIAFTVSTGLLTSICAVASLVSILASGNTLIYVAFYFTLGRLYSNSVLATLNARQIIRRLGENSDELSFSLQSVSKSVQRNPTSARSTNISIKIDTKHDFIRDQRQSSATEDPESAITEKSF
ncbi:hypothetical protein CPB84DRAFT_1840537 [Gymnopilus junonius]|uniref:DUF6534 domain-containing protein n=1 Tax=Gymnopilus junonius TaxID=109634 RepID=A0A9P5P2N0_GYMJU|nr:hypothetical protein CPB84DRAFT_1840537 [Gymnopilus junonius]